MENKARSRLNGMLGFAMRAGKVVIGTELVCTAMSRRGKDRARLALISCTASEATRNKIIHKGEFYGVETIVIDIDQDELGRLLGRLYAPSAVAITDDRFAEEIRLALGKISNNKEREFPSGNG